MLLTTKIIAFCLILCFIESVKSVIVWNENCTLKSGKPGVFRIKNDCDQNGESDMNLNICGGPYSICEDLVCCPVSNFEFRDKITCDLLDNAETKMKQHLYFNEECRVMGKTGIFTDKDDCPLATNVTLASLKACDYDFCKDYVCCPFDDWTKAPGKIYEDSHFQNIEIKGGQCFDEFRQTSGTCRPRNQCPTFDYTSNFTKCGYYQCSSLICCPNFKPDNSKKSNFHCNQYFKYGFDESRNVNVTPTRIREKCTGVSSISAFYPRFKDFGHMAALGHKSPDQQQNTWHCGGAIISEQFILTSKDCLNKTTSLVRLGSLGDTNPEIPNSDCPANYKVSEQFLHPTANIGLVKLETNLKFNTYVRPACLNSAFGEKNIRHLWGLSFQRDGQNNLKTLIKISLDIKDTGGNLYEAGIYSDYELSTGDPVHYAHPNLYMVSSLLGVVSHLEGNSVMFTKLSPVIDWIESIVWPIN